MCSASRKWHCWHSIGFNGPLAVGRIIAAIADELYILDGFDAQFRELVKCAQQDRTMGSADRWKKLQSDEAALAREKKNFEAAIAEYGPRPMFKNKLQELDTREKELARERYHLEHLRQRQLILPQSVSELQQALEDNFRRLATDSPEFGDLMKQLIPEFQVFSVRLVDGGHLLPRARIKLDLAGHAADAEHVPELKARLSRVLTIDLFKKPPQRERIREEAARLAALGLTQRQIAVALVDERPKLPAVQKALALDRMMKEQGLDSPYVLVREPPDDYPKLRRHKNPKYRFEPCEGYQRPAI